MLEHGGRLRAAAQRYGIPLCEWLDLSTGINPLGWPVPALPAAVWNRLPESDDGLLPAARDYYQCPSLLPLAGSQAAIQALPALRARSRVALPAIGYQEHLAAWQRQGHQLQFYAPDELEQTAAHADVVVVINPNNPGGERYTPAQLLAYHHELAARGGWLLVDEAFIDATPEQSLAPFTPRPGLLVLRSVGKFFGLAGIRAGFLLAEPALCQALDTRLGPWALSHPARWVCTQALSDRTWQRETRTRLQHEAHRLAALLERLKPCKTSGCSLFQTLYHERSEHWHRQLARQGILTRRFDQGPLLRFGLPSDERAWQRLARALEQLTPTGEPDER